MIKTKKGKILSFFGGLTGLIIIGGLGYYVHQFGMFTINPNKDSPPQFITANYINLSKVTAVSQYRSLAGHSFGDSTEKCLSLKHYFYTPQTPESIAAELSQKLPAAPDPNTGIEIYAPTNGTIITEANENYAVGKQIHMTVKSHGSYRIIMFHIYPLSSIKVGTVVKSGQRIGTIVPGYESDFAVTVSTLRGTQDISMFKAMTDKVFEEYEARGATSRDDFIVTKAYRAAHAFACPNDQFPQNSTVWQYSNVDGQKAEWVHLSGYTPPVHPGSQPNTAAS